MIKFENLGLRRGTRELLSDVSLVIHAGQKVGITGANGVGKSSLFALLLDELHVDAGELSIPKNLQIAHVAQEMPAVDVKAIDYVMDGDVALRELQQKIAQAESGHEGEKLGQYYSELENMGGYSAESRAATLLHGLGFLPGQVQWSLTQFSGGWRMRLNLAQALMCRSDILLLDEPTNHLDLDAVIWLESWLKKYTGTLLLISHDRDFLDNVVSHVAHIEGANITLYTGNYSAFEIMRAEKLANQQSMYDKQQREIAHMHKFVERFRAKATKARQAQSRIKALQRMEKIAPAHVDSQFHFSFREADKMPDPLVSLDQAKVGYDNKIILSDIKLTIHPGDRIGLLGHNGAGKSTLIKLLANELTLQSGEMHFAKEIRIGYFAQHQLEQLDSEASPLLHLQRIDAKATEKDLRNYLGGFGFNNDMALASVAPFSGGEKARLVLALLVYQKPNLVLLDEPTNHLDLEMRHALTVALQEYEGAMIVVSHDRHLLRTVADNLYLVDDGKLDYFDGTLEDYRQWVSSTDKPATTNSNDKVDTVDKKQQRRDAAQARKQLQPLKTKLNNVETKLQKLTDEKSELENQLADNDLYQEQNKEKLKALLITQASLEQSIEQLETEWMELSESIENFSG